MVDRRPASERAGTALAQYIEPVGFVERPEPPSISVVVRTRGDRPTTLEETLLCLAAQHQVVPQIIVVGHDVSDQDVSTIEALIDAWQGEGRIEFVHARGGRRGTPLNVGAAAATNDLVVFLDDDDLVLGEWLATFVEAASASPDRIIRAQVVRQEWEMQDGFAVAVGRTEPTYPPAFDLVEHLLGNQTPLHGLAFPRWIFSELGERFDEELDVEEDWDLVMRVAPVVGVASVDRVTAIYRWWRDAATTSRQHDAGIWATTHELIQSRIDAAPILLQPGALRRLLELEAGGQAVPVLREILGIVGLRTWRLSAPLRAISGERYPRLDAIAAMSVSQQTEVLERLRDSAGLRRIHRAIGAVRRVLRRR